MYEWTDKQLEAELSFDIWYYVKDLVIKKIEDGMYVFKRVPKSMCTMCTVYVCVPISYYNLVTCWISFLP